MGWRGWQGPALSAYRLESRPLVQTVVATGRVVTTSRVQAGSEVTGIVVERRVKEGDRVAAGSVLAVLRADDLTAKLREAEGALQSLLHSARPQAEAALRQAEAQLQQASRERQRRADLLSRQLVSKEQAEQAEQAELVARAAAERARAAALALGPGRSEEIQARERVAAARAAVAKTEIRAAKAGTVLTRNAEPGDLVQPGRVLFDLALDGPTEILLPVDEKNLSVLQLQQTAICIADAFPARPFTARLTFIAPAVDAQRGTADLRLTVDPVPDFLRQDMTVSVNLRTGERTAALVVPNDALVDVDDDRAALRVVRSGRVQRVPVRLGLRGLVLTEILSGASAGDTVLAGAATITLADGARARAQLQALPAAGEDAATRREIPVRFN
jgi:HlyD family secretion protein